MNYPSSHNSGSAPVRGIPSVQRGTIIQQQQQSDSTPSRQPVRIPSKKLTLKQLTVQNSHDLPERKPPVPSASAKKKTVNTPLRSKIEDALAESEKIIRGELERNQSITKQQQQFDTPSNNQPLHNRILSAERQRRPEPIPSEPTTETTQQQKRAVVRPPWLIEDDFSSEPSSNNFTTPKPQQRQRQPPASTSSATSNNIAQHNDQPSTKPKRQPKPDSETSFTSAIDLTFDTEERFSPDPQPVAAPKSVSDCLKLSS